MCSKVNTKLATPHVYDWLRVVNNIQSSNAHKVEMKLIYDQEKDKS